MTTIYKYRLEINDNVTIKMHEGAKILDVQVQHGNPFLWAIVDTEAPYENRVFEVYGTGHEMKLLDSRLGRIYIGTYQLSGGNLVFHVFEIDHPF